MNEATTTEAPDVAVDNNVIGIDRVKALVPHVTVESFVPQADAPKAKRQGYSHQLHKKFPLIEVSKLRFEDGFNSRPAYTGIQKLSDDMYRDENHLTDPYQKMPLTVRFAEIDGEALPVVLTGHRRSLAGVIAKEAFEGRDTYIMYSVAGDDVVANGIAHIDENLDTFNQNWSASELGVACDEFVSRMKAAGEKKWTNKMLAEKLGETEVTISRARKLSREISPAIRSLNASGVLSAAHLHLLTSNRSTGRRQVPYAVQNKLAESIKELMADMAKAGEVSEDEVLGTHAFSSASAGKIKSARKAWGGDPQAPPKPPKSGVAYKLANTKMDFLTDVRSVLAKDEEDISEYEIGRVHGMAIMLGYDGGGVREELVEFLSKVRTFEHIGQAKDPETEPEPKKAKKDEPVATVIVPADLGSDEPEDGLTEDPRGALSDDEIAAQEAFAGDLSGE